MGRWPRRLALLALVAGIVTWLQRAVLPSRPATAPSPIPRRLPDPDGRPSADGAGVRIVVNPSSGPAWTAAPTDDLRAGLPGADIVELGPDDDLDELLGDDDLIAVGAAGGDGTLAAVAVIAADRGIPLIAVPAGTLNHLARDLGLDTAADAIAAVRAGTAVRMDLGVAGDQCFVNTLSLGGYTQIVDARERFEKTIGKWPALLVALLTELPGMAPLRMEVDGEPRRVWLAWIGNCQYAPDGFGPRWRERLDDGLLDVRLVTGGRRFSRLRFAVDVLTGRLPTCPVYEERTATSLTIRSLDGPLRIAADGETLDGPDLLEIRKRVRALHVAVPPYDDDDPPRTSARPTSTTSPASTATPRAVSQGPASS
jgi:diacylglycerol kinase family enzyme